MATRTAGMRVPYGYLKEEFKELRTPILADIRVEALRGEWTLGPQVQELEEAWSYALGFKHSVGVSSGTDALFLALKVLGVGTRKAVYTVPNTFPATVGAILQAGAEPKFVDVGEDMLMDMDKLDESRYAYRSHVTGAVMPVDWAGNPVDTKPSLHGVPVIRDASQSVGAQIMGRTPDATVSAYSLHPLKNINVWGDGGMVCTNDVSLADEVRLLRNHGLEGRDVWKTPGYNMRLSTLQAIVCLHVLPNLHGYTEKRIANATRYNQGLAGWVKIPLVQVPTRHVYHLYMIQVDPVDRDGLLQHLMEAGVEARIHYPTPLHLQPALRHLGYSLGDFPVAERQSKSIITLPVHQFLSEDQIDYTIEQVIDYVSTR
jgi:aminotransferase EvaB